MTKLYVHEAIDYDLRAKYQHYNRLLFGGDLPNIPLLWKKLKGVGGKALAKIEIDPSKPRPHPAMVRLGRQDKLANYNVKRDSLAIHISTVYQRSEQALDMILIHEMIHIWCYTHGHIGAGHGAVFQSELRRCSTMVGFQVPLKDEVEGLEFAEPPSIKPLGVIAVESPTRFIYCIISEKTMRAGLDVLRSRLAYRQRMNQQVTFYIIADELWTKEAMKVSVQRTTNNVRYYMGSDPALLADLKANGTVIGQL